MPQVNRIGIVDIASGQLKKELYIGGCSAHPLYPCRVDDLRASADGKYVFGMSPGTSNVVIIETTTDKIVTKIGFTGRSGAIVGVDSSTNNLWIAYGYDDYCFPMLMDPPFTEGRSIQPNG